ncbi:Probable LRR receptor-like serine/threonine-protein kinase At3g47570 [Linum grandiflorum]
MGVMGKNTFLFGITFILLFTSNGVSSAPLVSPARVVSGIFSNSLPAFVKWVWSLKASTKTAMSGRPLMKFEPGYTVETMFDGSKAGIDPYSVEVLSSGELLVLDSANSNLYKIPSSLSLYTKPKLVAGSGEGYSGYVDGKPGVTTIAGGKRGNGGDGGGHVDGASEDAKFSNDFDVVYMGSSCSLLVIDRGNKAIREIQLHFDDCAYQYESGFPFAPRPFKSVLPPLIPTEDEQQQRQKQEETSFQSLWKFVASLVEIVGGMVPGFRKNNSPSALTYQFQNQHQRSYSAGWPMQDSYVIPDDDEPPTVEARTPTPKKKTYAFMSNDADNKMQRWRQGRSFYDGETPHQQQPNQHQHPRQQQHQSTTPVAPYTYYEQSHGETNEIVFGAVQEINVPKVKASVIKPVDYGDPMFDRYSIRVRSNSARYESEIIKSKKMTPGSFSVHIGVAVHLFFCCCASFSGVLSSNETDHQALLSFKSMISADPLGALSSWNGSTPWCRWTGVSCGARHGRVTALELQSRQLSGSISPHVGNLSFLRVLRLYNNSFAEGIPPEIGRLGRLQELEIYNNSLRGAIPSNISRCSDLTMFDVFNNELVGGLPWQFGLLNKLQEFRVSRNNLTGSIPSSFGNMSSLRSFGVGRNQLSGTIPDTLGRWKSIRLINLEENDFHGEIPASIFNSSTLSDVWFGINRLSGSLPSNLGISLPNLESFNGYANRLSGNVPPSLSNASNLFQLQLQDNNFTGGMPGLTGSSMLGFLAISGNSLGKDLSFLSSLTNATSLEFILFDDNNFGGSLPRDIGNLSASLQYLIFNDNEISGDIPNGIQHLVNLQMVMAHRNNLSGTIPSSIGNLYNLERLYLHENEISGSIPLSIGNLTRLYELSISINRLDGEIPASIQNCRRLSMLDLSDNNFSGAIPNEVMGLTSLSIALDLSENKFTGSLPTEVGNLRNLALLDLSHNMLSGSIPSSLDSCVSLESLDLQGNLLQGNIPSALRSLRGLEELDLSANNLSGQIPVFLEQMNISRLLNLSYNNFDGEVPKGGVFENSTIISVIGNNKLCGGISELELPSCNFKRGSNKALSRKWKIVISMVSILLVLVFVCSCLFIVLRKKRGKQDTVSVLASDDLLLQLSYQRLYKATDGFAPTNLIGEGSFGSVYKGVLDENEANASIAVKVLNLRRSGASKSFHAECEALKNIRHRNLVRIMTVCSGVDHQGNDFKAIIYELMANGSLEDWLHPDEEIGESVTRSLNFRQRVNVACDIAYAMDYLHNQCTIPIVHCDLKPSNVLLDEDMVAHVSDFGLARFLSPVANPSASSVSIKGTVGYAPPEYGMGNEVSIQGDVYSFGILLLEMFTGRRPTHESFKDDLSLHNIAKTALSKERAIKIADPMLQTELLHFRTTDSSEDVSNSSSSSISKETKKDLEELLSSILEIGVACSSNIPDERMSMSEVRVRLTTLKKFLPVERNDVAGSDM